MAPSEQTSGGTGAETGAQPAIPDEFTQAADAPQPADATMAETSAPDATAPEATRLDQIALADIALADVKPLIHGDIIELTVPALTTYLSVVRTATAGLAARLSFTFDEIEDLRIAVDEACVMLLSLPGPAVAEAPTLTCRFRVLSDALAVTVSAPVDGKAFMPAEQSFAWQVLTAHADEVTGMIDAGVASVGLRKPRAHR